MNKLVAVPLALTAALALARCPSGPPPVAGAPAGGSCGDDLECDSGLVCNCGTCESPDAAGDPPAACPPPADGCPPFPSACVDGCDEMNFVGSALCVDGLESCAPIGGVLETTCTCGEVPEGYRCEEGTLVCESPGITGCLTGDCSTQTPFLCVTSCGGTEFASSCIEHVEACDAVDGFPVEECGG
ncbi:MAG: hypothetical protein IT382_13355, partial [Deltaproteobacteria bacterium]|nr:hypothetical protein [Deltaproteobacteria bacterium]